MNAGPDLFVTVDRTRSLALVRGTAARRTVWPLSPSRPLWSPAGHGWVLPLAAVPDVEAYAEDAHLLLVVHDRRPADEVG